jgi:heme/copper-type cytochrome/quinol oxidase subunit 2
MVVLNPFFPEISFPCSKRNEKSVVEITGEAGNEKFEYICAIHGQGSKTKMIIIIVIVVVIVLLFLGCAIYCCIRAYKSRKQMVAIHEQEQSEFVNFGG